MGSAKAGTVFVLGAGASAHAGAPLMANFLDVAEKLNRGDAMGSDGPDFDLVFRALAQMQAVYAKAVVDSDNLEAVYAAFEMSEVLGSLGDMEPKELQRLAPAMRRVIVRTLEETISFPIIGRTLQAPTGYANFATLVKELKGRSEAGDVTVITFNYDLALDLALRVAGLSVNYALPDNPDAMALLMNRGPMAQLLKLHGSINWLRTKDGLRIVPWDIFEFLKLFPIHPARQGPVEKLRMSRGFGVAVDPRTNSLLAPDPVIVPPTWSKSAYFKEVAHVWQAARIAFSTAENIIVMGYSLPETDAFFRYLYAIGTIGQTRIKRFWVFDPGAREPLERRFRELLGETARRRFQLFSTAFGGDSSADAVNHVSHELLRGDGSG